MKKNLKEIEDIFVGNKQFLPLVMQKIEVKKSNIDITGKCVEVTVFKTNLLPIDNYYKSVTRILE